MKLNRLELSNRFFIWPQDCLHGLGRAFLIKYLPDRFGSRVASLGGLIRYKVVGLNWFIETE